MFGQTNYYDESGNRVGESWPGLVEGTESFYGVDGELKGSSCFGLASDQVYHDAENAYLGSSVRTLYGHAFFDGDGEYVGNSSEIMSGESFDFF